MTSRRKARRPPRLIIRTLAATFATVLTVLAAVFAILVLHTRQVVQRGVIEHLEEGQQLLALLEKQREREASVQATILTESPTLKAAIDTYLAEQATGAGALIDQQALATVEREVIKLASFLGSDIVSVALPDGTVLASAGLAYDAWPHRGRLALDRNHEVDGAFEQVVTATHDRFRVTGAPIILGDAEIGVLLIGSRLDTRYARQLASVSHTNIAITTDAEVVATTLATTAQAAFRAAFGEDLADATELTLAGESFAVKRLHRLGPVSFYALDSIDAATNRTSQAAVSKLVVIALGALLLAALASFWLARSTAEPIDRLARELQVMAASPETRTRLTTSGTSAEIDGLVTTFNDLMRALGDARAETDAAYVGAIRALAAALDARDAYTAGHSERVSALSVAIGRKMKLGEPDLAVLRLGALLHDIGKIGISDAILCKPQPLTHEEFQVIKTHPAVGAQILRSIAFLEPHIPIVELHHERPDGTGYPYGLRGTDIPVLARIVHVADAFDAMTTARAYRVGRPASEAMTELWRYAGTQFDAEVVEAFAAALPLALAELQQEHKAGSVIPFERRVLWA